MAWSRRTPVPCVVYHPKMGAAASTDGVTKAPQSRPTLYLRGYSQFVDAAPYELGRSAPVLDTLTYAVSNSERPGL